MTGFFRVAVPMRHHEPPADLRLKHSIGLGLVLVAVWLLLSGHYTPLLLALGALSCGGVLAISIRMNVVDREGAPVELPLRALRYLPWLLWEIMKANVDVAGRILHPRMPISPTLIKMRCTQIHDIGRVIYANSITLTPGTVSVDTHGEEITVHALTAEAAEDLLEGSMDRRVTRMEGAR
jgi:multicomponent Na+:H+ antiporter subunit E